MPDQKNDFCPYDRTPSPQRTAFDVHQLDPVLEDAIFFVIDDVAADWYWPEFKSRS
jgi:hypothetical protein